MQLSPTETFCHEVFLVEFKSTKVYQSFTLQKCRSLPSKLLPCLNTYRRKARAKKGKVPDEDKFNELTMNMAVKDQSLPLSLEDIAYMEERERRESLIQQRKNNAVRIDRVSRILFPVAFVCYTVGYWISYS